MKNFVITVDEKSHGFISGWDDFGVLHCFIRVNPDFVTCSIGDRVECLDRGYGDKYACQVISK